MTREVLVACGMAALCVAIAYIAAAALLCGYPLKISCGEMSAFGPFYGERLRGSLFAGFLTLGGFLLSLKTFIVVNMKKEVFDTEEYREEWSELQILAAGDNVQGRFEPLRYLSQVLFLAIISCVATAILQLTIGLFETIWAALVCLWSVLVSLHFLWRSLWLIRINLNRMFDFLDARDNRSVGEDSSKPG